MPRYFFNIEGAGYPSTDEEGCVLEEFEQARAELVVFAGELLRDAAGRFGTEGAWRLRVDDEDGITLCTISIIGETRHK